ncbi:MAG: right-handed parallel beta-helix repeat-containing protein [Candidatus Thorarchaeota archaeon]
MVRKAIPIILIILLGMQAFVLASSSMQLMPSKSGEGIITRQAVTSQGSRLSPGDYFNHVPFLIDELSDFDLLGFPGEGTLENPYVISSFNITSPINYDSIRVVNIDAYVTIVDCFINQEANEYGIYLVNTSHVTVEYVTIESIGGGIYCLNANNTQISHSQVIVDVMAVSIDNSNDCYLYGNYLEGVSATCNVIGSTAFVSENNEYHASVIGSSLILVMANDSRSIADYFDTPTTSVTISQSTNFILSDANIVGINGGFVIDQSESPIITRCTISTENNNALSALDCPNIIVNESSLVSSNGDAIHLESCNYTQILENTIPYAGYLGIYVGDSFQPNVSRNSIDAFYSAVYLVNCEQSLVSMNEMTRAMIGAGIEDCNNSAMTFNYAYDIALVAFHSQDGFNVSFTDNIVNNATRGGVTVNVEDWGSGLEICRNQFTNIKWWVISAYRYSDIIIKNNTMSVMEGEWLWALEGIGIKIENCNNLEIEGNHIWDGITGILTASCVNMTIDSNVVGEMVLTGIGGFNNVNSNVTNNVVESCDQNGITLGMDLVSGSPYRGPPTGTISGNNLTECGFMLRFESFSQFEDHSYHDNSVNAKPLFYGYNLSTLTLDGNSYGQVILFNCSDIAVTGGDDVFSNAGTNILFSSEILVDDYSFIGISMSFFVYQSHNITISNLTCECQEVDEIANGWGFRSSLISDSSDVLVKDSVLIGNGENSGFYSFKSNHVRIEQCNIFDMAVGVLIRESANCTIAQNNITKSVSGVHLFNSGTTDVSGLTIVDNEIRHGSTNGIYIRSSNANRGLIRGNTIESCETGIYLEAVTNWTIQNNNIRWNEEYGLHLIDTAGSNVSYNNFGFNMVENGYDNQAQNWDDNVSLGNYWFDYSPPGVYPISGGAGAQDRYPQQYIVTEPIIDQLLDLYYAEGTSDNILTWHPVDDSLRDWQVTIDGDLWAADAWNLDNISIYVDGLPYGEHELVITVWDVSQNNVTDTVLIHVFDDTPPGIDGPPDTIAFEDGTDQILTWDISDLHPDTYQININDEEVESGTWTTGEFHYSIDGLTAGLNTISLTIFDIDGNRATDTVMVQVYNDDDEPTIDSPDDITFDYGVGGHQIVWTAEDAFPARYELSMNGSVVLTEDWSGSRIVVALTGLEVGTHYFGVTVYDGSGRSASDEVRVIVLSIIGDPITTAETSLDPNLILMIGAGIGAVVVIVVVLYILKKRSAG